MCFFFRLHNCSYSFSKQAVQSIYTVSQKNVHLFISQVTQKLTDFNDFWCAKS